MKKAFTLIEMMVAVLLGSIIVMVIAGTLSSSIKAWEAVQTRVSENYNRRTVLDLVKRQSSSLFMRKDADAMAASNPLGQNAGNNRSRRGGRGQGGAESFNPPVGRQGFGYQLPEGAYYFRGDAQSINFLSTISFLSDFPGQVAVRYYVVQGEPGDDESFLDLENSRVEYDPEMDFEAQVGDASLEGGLYLYLEEKNLFLSNINASQGLEDPAFTDPTTAGPVNLDPPPASGSQGLEAESMGEVVDTHTMKLLGPLRHFSIRYRIPGTHGVSEADSEENWSEYWDLDAGDGYPSAIEFTFIYENGASEETATEDLPGIRMVIPVYDEQNLRRGVRDEHRPFN